MAEFALILPLLALLLFGIIQCGIVFHNYVEFADATRAGARKAAVSRDFPDPAGAAAAAGAPLREAWTTATSTST